MSYCGGNHASELDVCRTIESFAFLDIRENESELGRVPVVLKALRALEIEPKDLHKR